MAIIETKEEEIERIIIEYIKKSEYASYRDLEILMYTNGFNYKGDLDIVSTKNENIVYWTGWKEEAINLIEEMQAKGVIRKDVADYHVYFGDGKVLTLPLVNQRREYKTLHWLPVVFKPLMNSSKR